MQRWCAKLGCENSVRKYGFVLEIVWQSLNGLKVLVCIEVSVANELKAFAQRYFYEELSFPRPPQPRHTLQCDYEPRLTFTDSMRTLGGIDSNSSHERLQRNVQTRHVLVFQMKPTEWAPGVVTDNDKAASSLAIHQVSGIR